jgi:hypothetical protein
LKEISHIKKLIQDLDGQVAPSQFTEEELVPSYDSDEVDNRTFDIEPTGTVYNNKINEATDTSEFSFFEDAKQRTIQIGFIPAKDSGIIKIIPIHYYAIGAVILKRTNRKLSLWNKPALETGVVIHKKTISDKAKINQLELLGVNVIDTSTYDTNDTGSTDYYTLKRWALEAVKKRKQKTEQELIEKWRLEEKTESFLVIDGSLINLRGEENLKRCIGLSKTSRMKMDNYDKIMQLKEFERSWTFSFHSDEEGDDKSTGVRERVSWYLRLRDKSNSDPEFGLIRSELHFSYKSQAKTLADKLSKSLLLERLPTSYPEGNWDRTIYPIAVCGNYLSSIMPSIRTIKASIKL